ncbi:MAG: 4Fe-4S dicluster domain-containing protein [Armatimonadota bacterium]|nr:4Fe-4S dicluster domain-containing protein [Armatimonadota bacterium]MDR7582934.1 4Fe-4S dicluster domain-containing protein [Armatimonadota bacterium]
MRLTRRSFLTSLAAVAAALSGSRAVAPLARWRRGVKGAVPALVARPEGVHSLAHLEAVPAGGGVALAFAAKPPRAEPAAASGRRWVMVIDLARCDGCRECTRACQAMHFLPGGQEWIRVYEMRDHELGAPYWLPRPCMQCDNPPCVKVCPVSATWKREDGIVMQDTSRCIGCRFCMAACPYQARSFNWVDPEVPGMPDEPYAMEWNRVHRRGTTEKCIFCPALLAEGRLPACAAACPMGAIYFGDQGEDAVTNSQGETVRLSELVAANAGYRLLEELGTEPRVYYLPPRRPLYPPPPPATEPASAGEARR